MDRHKQHLVKTPEIHHNSSENHEMIIFSKFQLNPSIFQQDVKYKDHLIMSLGASLTWNNFWTNFFFSQTVFTGWKTLLSSTFWQKMRKILRVVFGKIPKYLKNFVKVLFSPILSPKFMQNIRKVFRADSEKKILLTNRLTDNTEFIGPFSLGVPFKMILCQLLRFVYFSLKSDSYFQFS